MWHPKRWNSVSRIIEEHCEAPFLARRRKYLHDLETEGIIEDNHVPSENFCGHSLELVESRQQSMADLPILDAMSESLLCVREGIRQGMAPRQERSRGNRSVCNACIGREVEGSRRRMGRRSLGIREALEDKINHSPNRGWNRGFISFLIFPRRGRWTGRRRPRWGSLKRAITRRSTGRVLTSR